MLNLLEQDYRRYGGKPGSPGSYLVKALKNAGFRAVLLYRLGVWLRLRKVPLLPGLVERVMHHACHCWISLSAEIGPGFLIAHVGGLVVGGQTRIGANCDVRQNVTFGGNFNRTDASGRSQPWLEDNVSVGVGAVLAGPVRVGANAIIGANSVVTRDVPANVIVSGVPAQVIKERWDEGTGRKL